MDRGKTRDVHSAWVAVREPIIAAAEANGTAIRFGDGLMDHPLVVGARIGDAASKRECIPPDENRPVVGPDSHVSSLTDFVLDLPITVALYRTIDEAWQDMERHGTHALLVTGHAIPGVDPQVVGLITARDIQRARPRDRHGAVLPSGRASLLVRDVMTPWEDLPYVNYDSLKALTAMDLFEMFQGTGLTHLVAVETRGADLTEARGILSRDTLAKELGQ